MLVCLKIACKILVESFFCFLWCSMKGIPIIFNQIRCYIHCSGVGGRLHSWSDLSMPVREKSVRNMAGTGRLAYTGPVTQESMSRNGTDWPVAGTAGSMVSLFALGYTLQLTYCSYFFSVKIHRTYSSST